MSKRKHNEIEDGLCTVFYECKTTEQNAIVPFENQRKRQKIDEHGLLPSTCLIEKKKVKEQRIQAWKMKTVKIRDC